MKAETSKALLLTWAAFLISKPCRPCEARHLGGTGWSQTSTIPRDLLSLLGQASGGSIFTQSAEKSGFHPQRHNHWCRCLHVSWREKPVSCLEYLSSWIFTDNTKPYTSESHSCGNHRILIQPCPEWRVPCPSSPPLAQHLSPCCRLRHRLC